MPLLIGFLDSPNTRAQLNFSGEGEPIAMKVACLYEGGYHRWFDCVILKVVTTFSKSNNWIIAIVI